MDFRPFTISMQVALFATCITFLLGLAAANYVYRMKRGKGVIDTIFTLPMILPPTVAGFFLLMLFGRNGFIGRFLDSVFGITVVFSWTGAVIASIFVSFPLMYRTARGAFEQIDQNVIYAAETLGFSKFKIFWMIKVPMAKAGILAGTVLSFARALGEFGATIMLAGNIPGRTQTMSIAVFSAVSSGNREVAYIWVAVLSMMSFVMIMLMNHWAASGKAGKSG
ncbi:MAG: molybdate ABC transporter permease subunit [Defluviitaleaceae bacterium]|nr:molybdate ABC transporter permease subunit [Defluviitaleaceae bacterium]